MACASEFSPCCIGKSLNSPCHEICFTKFKGFRDFEEFSEENQQLLILRCKVSQIKQVCFHHEKIYLSRFENVNGKFCCDPFKKHKTNVKSTYAG